mmetsp:Transcript_21970/g.54127  ORF Transcript_21970/g.54127 Transcript_21970/m.54127 type:complete len:291 (+) Transcript_21970:147-1019(+)
MRPSSSVSRLLLRQNAPSTILQSKRLATRSQLYIPQAPPPLAFIAILHTQMATTLMETTQLRTHSSRPARSPCKADITLPSILCSALMPWLVRPLRSSLTRRDQTAKKADLHPHAHKISLPLFRRRRLRLDWRKVGVLQRILRRDTRLVVVAQALIQKVERLRRHKVLVVAGHKRVPALTRVAPQDAVVVAVELHIVLVQVRVEVVGAEHLRDLDKLIVVVVTMEEGLFPENHSRKHGPKAPHVERVVILPVVDEQLRALEVARCHPHVVLSSRTIKLGEPPVNQSKFTL